MTAHRFLVALVLATCGCDGAPPTGAPEPLLCRTDADCMVTCHVAGDCCGETCACSRVASAAHVEAMSTWRASECRDAACPVADCPRPRVDVAAVCVERVCRAIETPVSPVGDYPHEVGDKPRP